MNPYNNPLVVGIIRVHKSDMKPSMGLVIPSMETEAAYYQLKIPFKRLSEDIVNLCPVSKGIKQARALARKEILMRLDEAMEVQPFQRSIDEVFVDFGIFLNSLKCWIVNLLPF